MEKQELQNVYDTLDSYYKDFDTAYYKYKNSSRQNDRNIGREGAGRVMLRTRNFLRMKPDIIELAVQSDDVTDYLSEFDNIEHYQEELSRLLEKIRQRMSE